MKFQSLLHRFMVHPALIVFFGLFFVGCEHSPSARPTPGAQARSDALPEKDKNSAEGQGVVEEQAASREKRSSPEAAPEHEGSEAIVLAGGCFWGMEEILRDIPGVLETEVGYAGGRLASPTYGDVKTGTTGHAESVLVVFDPQVVALRTLLKDWFFRMHDPTTKNRQGNDVGTQYRSAIFYYSEGQKGVALSVKKEVEESGAWQDPVVTEIAQVGAFTPAEGYHQDYLQKNPGGYTCHYMRDITY